MLFRFLSLKANRAIAIVFLPTIFPEAQMQREVLSYTKSLVYTLTALYADNALQATVEPATEPITVEDATGGSSPSQGVGALDLLASAATNGAPRRSRVQQTARPRKAQASGLRRTTQRHKPQASGLRKTARRRKPILNRFDPAHGV